MVLIVVNFSRVSPVAINFSLNAPVAVSFSFVALFAAHFHLVAPIVDTLPRSAVSGNIEFWLRGSEITFGQKYQY